MAELRNPLYLLPALLILIPINIYVAGDWPGTGIQWALFRVQVTPGGESLISFTQEIHMVLTGLITGTTGLAFVLWTAAVLLLLGYFIVTIWAMLTEKEAVLRRNALILPACGALFLISDLVHFGIFLSGPEGLCIPAGIPLFFLFGIRGYSYGFSMKGKTLSVHEKESQGILDCPASRLRSWFELNANREILSLIIISIIVKTIVFFSGLLPNLPLHVILGDTKLYYWYATSLTWGQVPYSSYYVPYPQFFFIPLLIALIPALIIQNYPVYLYSFSGLMVIVDTATLLLVYSIAGKLWGQSKAFLCGLLYATAFSAAFFVPIYYDAVPSFLLILSLWMFLYRSEMAGYLLATAGVLTKWFPFFALPYYLLHGLKTGRRWKDFTRPILYCSIMVILTIVPFILLNTGEFLRTYTVHIGRMPEVNSSIYYLDTLCSFLFNANPFHSFSFLLVIVAELALLSWYFRRLDSGAYALIGCIFLSIFVFVFFNRVFSTNYIIWLTPFLALLLCRTPRHILLFYLIQLVMYLETPVLFGIVYAPFNAGYDAVTRYDVLVGSLPTVSFLFYTIKFAILVLVFWVIARDLRKDAASPES